MKKKTNHFMVLLNKKHFLCMFLLIYYEKVMSVSDRKESCEIRYFSSEKCTIL